MSLASYIGCNVEIPLTEPDSNDVIVFGSCFADESMLEMVQEYQFQTNYIYEVSTSWGIELVEWQNVKEKRSERKTFNFMQDYGRLFGRWRLYRIIQLLGW